MTLARAELGVLGGFLLSVDGERRDVSARKVKALLCRLAVDPEPLGRDALAALLWPDSAPAAARHSLRQALSELRRLLDGTSIELTVSAQEVGLHTTAGEIDVRRFRALAAAGRPEDWEAAMTLYRGALLEGLDVRVDTFDEWLDATRTELAATALRLCRALAEHHADDVERGVAWSKRLLALDPLDEAAHQDLMRLYIAADQDGAAIRQYLHCRSLLERELGIAPQRETTALYEGLLTHRTGAAPRHPAATPPDRGRQATPAATPTVAAGGPQPDPTPPARRLRPAVVLSCQLASDDDPEAADAHRASQLEVLSRVMRSYGGRVVGQAADQVLCGFGLDRVRGTEADRACLAGAELVAAVPGVRVGIASGQVLFRPEEGALVGQAATDAQALCARTEAGEVRVSNTVAAAQRGPAPAAESTRVPLVGRALEIRQFVAVLDACRDGGYGAAMLIRGEPGIGKTRLVEEYLLLAQREGFAVHRGQAYDFGTARGRDALSQIVRSLLGAALDDPSAMAARVGEQRLPYLQTVLGLEPEPARAEQMAGLTPYERLDRSAEAVVELLRDAARASALVIVADDLHWADRLTLAVLPRLARAAAELPVAVLMTSRVAGEALDPQWRAAMGGAPLVTLDLQPLRLADAGKLASAFGADSRDLERLLERAGGNPLFIEQLVRSERLGQDLPYSIQGLAVAQLEALPEAAQAGLCAASVLGQFFDPEAVAATAGTSLDLDAALHAGLIQRGESEWQFHHALIRDGIYQNVLPSERRRLHRRAADYFRDTSLTLHAQHLDLAGAEQADAALVAAAADEIEHYRLARARDLVRRALQRSPEHAGALLLDAQLELMLGNTARAAELFRTCRGLAWEDSVRARSLVGLGMALNQLDRHAEAVEALEAATRLNPQDHEYQADAWLQLGNALFPQGRTAETLRAHQTALHHAQQAGSTLREARAEGGLGDAYYQQGAMLTAHAHFDRCVALGTRHSHPSVVPANQAMRALAFMYQNRLREALADGEAALAAAQASSNLRHQLLAHNVLASLQSFHGDTARGLHHAERTITLGQRIGSRRFVVDGRAQLVHLLWAAGRVDDARRALADVEACLDASLMPFAGAYVRGLQSVCATSASERRRFLEDGRRLLGHASLSHCHLYFYVAAMEACLVAGEAREALELAAGLEAYTAAEPLPWSDFYIRVTRAVAGGTSAEERAALRREAEVAGLGVGMRLL